MWLDSYVEGDARPIRIKLKTQSATKEILARTFKLKDCEEYKQVFINKKVWMKMKQKFEKYQRKRQVRKNKVRTTDGQQI